MLVDNLSVGIQRVTDVEKKFSETAWGQKLAKRKAKAAMGDFDRFKVQQQRMKKSAAVNKALGKMKA